MAEKKRQNEPNEPNKPNEKNKKHLFDQDLLKKLLPVFMILYSLLMIFGAAYSKPQEIPVFGGHTKIFHFFGFAFLAVLLLKFFDLYLPKNRSGHDRNDRQGWHGVILTVLIIVLFAVLTEILQLYVATRHFLFRDMLIDVSGGALGLILYWLAEFIFARINTKPNAKKNKDSNDSESDFLHHSVLK